MDKKESEAKFPLDKLRTNCRELFGVSTSTFDGAAATIGTEAVTVKEMKATIKKWSERSV